MSKFYISSTKYNLQERTQKSGKRVFDLYTYVTNADGQYKQIKKSGFATKAKAREWYIEFVQNDCEIVKERPRRTKETAESEELTLREYCDLYIASLRNQNKESSIHDKANMYKSTILPMFGREEKPSHLTKERLYRWQDDLWASQSRKGKPYSYRSLTNIKKNLGALLSWISDRYGKPNHLREIKTPRATTPRREMQIWTREEFDRFIACVDDPRYHCFFSMLFFTGRRKGEIIALQSKDIHEDSITFDKTYTRRTIDGAAYKITPTKNMKSGETVICDPLRAELKNYAGESPFFFGGTAPIHENTIGQAFLRYIRISGVKRIRLHDLRHSFVSMLIHYGANPFVVADIIGDRPEQIMRTYGHLWREDVDRVLALIK